MPDTPTIDSLVVADPPEAWEAAGFTVDTEAGAPGGGVCRVGSVRIELVGRDHGRRIVAWKLRGIATGCIDGLVTMPVSEEPRAPAVHSNGVELIDHLVVLTPNLERTVTALSRLGIEPRRTRSVDADQYGFPAVQTFFRMGEVILELIGGTEPTGDGPASFFGLAFTVSDLEATQRMIGEHLSKVKDAVQPGRRITTLRHKELGISVATAFMSRGEGSI